MPWRALVLAFLAGYGLMNLFYWGLFGLWRWLKRPCPPPVLVLAAGGGDRLEGVLRTLHRLQENGHLAGISVLPGHEEYDLACRLAGELPGIEVRPPTTSLLEMLPTMPAASLWLIDLARLPAGTSFSPLFPPPSFLPPKQRSFT